MPLNVPVRSSVTVAVVQVRVGSGRRLAGRVISAAGYDAKVAGTQHGVLLVGRRGRLQERRQLGQIVGLLVQPRWTGVVAELAEQRPERRQEVLAVRGRVPPVLRAVTVRLF